MKLVIGLGNYGDEYAYTFHNMGYLAAEAIADKLNVKFSKRECDAHIAVAFIDGEKVIIAKPLTYMNLSGRAAKQLLKKYNVEPKDMIALFDDIDLNKASIRVRASGSGGTHNGMRNIIECIGTTDFPRVRIGIGKPPENVPLADYVLSNVPSKERQLMFDAIDSAAEEALKLIRQTDATAK